MADNPRLAALKAKLIAECERLLDKPGAMLRREAVFKAQANQLCDQLYDNEAIVADPEMEAKNFESELSHRFPLVPLHKSPVPSAAEPEAAKSRARVPLLFQASPYRFVELNDTVVKAEDKPVLHKPRRPGGFTGRISVEWAVETPMLIGKEGTDGMSRPLRLPDGRYAIPGATLRGMMRASAEIVAGARLSQINGHHRYGLRDFTHPKFRTSEGSNVGDQSLLRAENVKAGWLRCSRDGKQAWIMPCGKWSRIDHARLQKLIGGVSDSNYLHWRHNWLRKDLLERYNAIGALQIKDNKGFVHFKSLPAWNFIVPNGVEANALAIPSADGQSGHLVFSNKSPSPISLEKLEEEENSPPRPGKQKKHEYVFFDSPNAQWLEVDPAAWNQFWLINTKPARRDRVPDGSLGLLWSTLERGDKVPVFYVEQDFKGKKSLQLGLTRFFKIAHEHSVRNLLDKEAGEPHAQPANPASFKPDLVESLFGHVLEADDFSPPGPKGQSVACKGRVAFGFAYLDDPEEVEETKPIRTVMGAPRASFAPFYLAGRIKDYSHPDARLAGRKRYVPRFRQQDLVSAPARLAKSLEHQVDRLRLSEEKFKKIGSTLHLLRHKRDGGKMIFRSDIRVRNVTAVELGLLLWVLTHGGDPAKPYRHQIGRAKPFGAGQVLVRGLRLSLQPHDPADRSLMQTPDAAERAGASGEGWTDGTLSLRPFLKAFETFMAQHWTNWPHVRPVTQWLRSCRPDWGAEQVGQRPEPEGRFTYPDLKEFNTIRKAVKMDNKQPAPHPDNPVSLLGVPSE